jgi:hypothetical protein
MKASGTAWVALLVTICAGCERDPYQLREVPDSSDYCLAAQKVITKTEAPVVLDMHDEFMGFVKSKAIIDPERGPVIQQYNWHDADGNLLGISCKLKSADHLNLEFGAGTAGPDGLCQDMNRAVFTLIAKAVRSPAFSRVTFDPVEVVQNEDQPGMTGPDWLAPFKMTYVEDDTLHIASKGFVVDFTDPRYADAPERFRGVHYCHLIAPEYLTALLSGTGQVDAVIGREVDRSAPPPQTR